MPWIDLVAPADATGRLRKLYDAAVARAGRVFNVIMAQSRQPEVLDASKGSISTNTRMLLASGLVHRTTVAGRRGAFFEVGPNTWREMMEQELAAIRKMRALFDSGLRVLADAPPERRARLEDMNFVYDFIESEWSGLMDRVYEAREAHVRARVAAPKEDPCVD